MIKWINYEIAILSSCAGFGTYTPSLLLRDELNDINVDTTVFVYETFLSEQRSNNLSNIKKIFIRILDMQKSLQV